jgi:hypothetical protein
MAEDQGVKEMDWQDHQSREKDEESIPANLAIDPSKRAVIERRLKLKLDLRCGMFVVIYIMNYLDRNNIATARLRAL